MNMPYAVTKKIIDIFGSLAGIVLLAPFFLIICLLVKLDSPGPVIFFQRRCGKGGKEFEMLKFRTMVREAEQLKERLQNEAEGSVFKVKKDPRVTTFGKILRRTCADELPQLFHVLKGEMSLVGPRPLAAHEMDGQGDWKELRLSVKPGITGLWQVKRTDDRKFDEWLKYDKEYIENRSLGLDVKILFMTISTLIKGTGAY